MRITTNKYGQTIVLPNKEDTGLERIVESVLRVNEMHRDIMRDLILSWLWEFCDQEDEKAKEISMVKMLDKYGWDFEYVRPSETTKAEEIFLNERG